MTYAPNRCLAQRACATCGGTGTVRVEIYNTATGKWQTITQTCTACLR
jgi:DnaJ-class molecular chaperone